MMMIRNNKEYSKAQKRFSRMFDIVIERTGRYSSSAILEALGPQGAAEFRELRDAMAAYKDKQVFCECLRSGDYRS